MQVWSNPWAIREYQDLLNGVAPEATKDGASVIIGKGKLTPGKLGTSLANLGLGDDVLLGRGEELPATITDKLVCGGGAAVDDNVLEEYPIYVAVPLHEVKSVIEATPEERKRDLVFLQSDGSLEPLLKSKYICRKDQTQALLYWDIKEAGAKPIDLATGLGTDKMGIEKYAGQSVVCGKWAGSLTERLQRSDLLCESIFYDNWRREMLEKVVFGACFNLVGALHDFQSVGDIGEYYAEEVGDMMNEMQFCLRGQLAVTIPNGYPERAYALAATMRDVPTAMDPLVFPYRNGIFWEFAKLSEERGFPDTCPMHTEYMGYGISKGLFTIPDKAPID
ncbi:unnamed protein product [Chrysoparadoxa australica]